MQQLNCRKNYDAIDACKFIACLLVVGIHTSPLRSFGTDVNFAVFQVIARLAVPFFFVSSAFFLFRGGRTDGAKIRRYEKHLATLYALWFVLSLPATWRYKYEDYFSDHSIAYALLRCVRGIVFGSSFRTSWYLCSSMFCAAAVYWLSKRMRTRWILLGSALIYAFCIATSLYGHVFEWIGLGDVLSTLEYWYARPYTSIVTGMLYFTIGKWFADHEQQLIGGRLKRYALWVLLGLAVMEAEAWFAYRRNMLVTTDCFFGLVPAVCFLMLFLMNCSVEIKDSHKLRVVSIITFLSHYSYLCLFQATGIRMNSLLRYALVLALSFTTAAVVMKLENRPYCRWMKKLH